MNDAGFIMAGKDYRKYEDCLPDRQSEYDACMASREKTKRALEKF